MMPVFNEERTLEAILEAVLARPEVCEVIAVDDASEDGSWAILQSIAAEDSRLKAFRQPRNQGKGAALRLAITHLTAPLAIVQDADLEYDPDDYPMLLKPVLDGRTDVVFGIRRFSGQTAYSYWFVKGNQWLTWTCNILFNCYLSDLLTGYKLLRSDLWRRLRFTDSGFAADAEIAARILSLGYRVHEIPIEYVTRSRAEGKKVTARDGFAHLWAMIRVRFHSRRALFGADEAYHRERQAGFATRHRRRGGGTAA